MIKYRLELEYRSGAPGFADTEIAISYLYNTRQEAISQGVIDIDNSILDDPYWRSIGENTFTLIKYINGIIAEKESITLERSRKVFYNPKTGVSVRIM